MPLTDLSFLREFCRNDRQKMAHYVKTFLESVPEIMNELNLRLSENDPVTLKKTVHAIKPQVTFLGLEGLKEQVEGIELAIENSASSEQLASMVNQMKSSLEHAADELVETLISLS